MGQLQMEVLPQLQLQLQMVGKPLLQLLAPLITLVLTHWEEYIIRVYMNIQEETAGVK